MRVKKQFWWVLILSTVIVYIGIVGLIWILAITIIMSYYINFIKIKTKSLGG